jgi:hypothetical protein
MKLYYYPYLPKTNTPLHSAFEINTKVHVQEKKAIDLAAWYLNRMPSQASARPVPFQKLFMAFISFIDWLRVTPQRELAHSHK